MAMASTRSEALIDRPAIAEAAGPVANTSYVEWGPVIAGAVGATAISFVLLTFGSAAGLSAISPWPNAGVSLTWAVVLTGLFVALVHVGSLAAGGYIAGRMRAPWADGAIAESQFRDGVHGFLVWALAVIAGAWLVASTTAEGVRTGVQASAVVGAGAASGAAGRNATPLAQGPSDYAVDLLLRPSSNAAIATRGTPQADQEVRAELGRIFLGGLKNSGLAPRERTYLAQLVIQRTGLAQAEAEKRVDDAFMEARVVETQAREAADKTRKIAAVAAFLAAATLLVGCAAAAAGAGLGGRHRDEKKAVRLFGRQRFW